MVVSTCQYIKRVFEHSHFLKSWVFTKHYSVSQNMKNICIFTFIKWTLGMRQVHKLRPPGVMLSTKLWWLKGRHCELWRPRVLVLHGSWALEWSSSCQGSSCFVSSTSSYGWAPGCWPLHLPSPWFPWGTRAGSSAWTPSCASVPWPVLAAACVLLYSSTGPSSARWLRRHL